MPSKCKQCGKRVSHKGLCATCFMVANPGLARGARVATNVLMKATMQRYNLALNAKVSFHGSMSTEFIFVDDLQC